MSVCCCLACKTWPLLGLAGARPTLPPPSKACRHLRADLGLLAPTVPTPSVLFVASSSRCRCHQILVLHPLRGADVIWFCCCILFAVPLPSVLFVASSLRCPRHQFFVCILFVVPASSVFRFAAAIFIGAASDGEAATGRRRVSVLGVSVLPIHPMATRPVQRRRDACLASLSCYC